MSKIVTRWDHRIKRITTKKFLAVVDLPVAEMKTIEPLYEVPADIKALYETKRAAATRFVGWPYQVSFEGMTKDQIKTVYALVAGSKARIYPTRFVGYVGAWRLRSE